MYYAIIDCDNCYVSCERVFRPDLNGTAVVVLSNNDGCVVARSKEAKQLGIKAGMPYYQMAEKYRVPEDPATKNIDPRLDKRPVVHVFSSNYELYGDLTRRVMSIVEAAAPEFYRYSIDEAFCRLEGMDHMDLKKWGEDLAKKVLKWTGIPVSIGIARTKTLAKCADRFAKDYPGYNKCCMIDSEEKRLKALKMFPVDEVWGVGRRFRDRLQTIGVKTAYDFVMKPQVWVRKEFHLPGERTWLELQGTDCIPMEQNDVKKSICTSRSFPGLIEDFDSIYTHVANFAARCAEKLRGQGSVCKQITVFLATNPFREDLPQYSNSHTVTLLTPVNSTIEIVKTAHMILEHLYRKGYKYKRAGVIVNDISDASTVQTNFIDYDAEKSEKMKRLSKAMDAINKRNGAETVVLGAQQYPKEEETGKAGTFSNAIKHDFRSKNFTTRWSDIMKVK